MGFRDGAYCKLWKLDNSGKFPSGQISISYKDKTSGEYVDDFSGFVTFVGDAAKAVDKMTIPGRFKINGCDVSRTYNKEKQKEFIYFRVFNIEEVEDRGPQKAPTKRESKQQKASDDMSVAELEARLAEAKLRESGKKVADSEDDLPF